MNFLWVIMAITFMSYYGWSTGCLSAKDGLYRLFLCWRSFHKDMFDERRAEAALRAMLLVLRGHRPPFDPAWTPLPGPVALPEGRPPLSAHLTIYSWNLTFDRASFPYL